MPINGWLALAGAVVLLLSPLIVLTAPLWGVWLWLQRRSARQAGWRALLPIMAETLEAAAAAMVRGPAPDGGWVEVARRADTYLASIGLSRRWRAQLVVCALQILPLLTLQPPFTRMSPTARREFVARHLATTRGLFGLASLGRQMVRMGYYAAPGPQRAVGFLPVGQRRNLRADARSRALTARPAHVPLPPEAVA